MAKIKQTDKNEFPLWALNYYIKKKQVGYISQLGDIMNKNSEVKVVDNKLIPIKKNAFSTWQHTFKKINSMLKQAISNFNDTNVVEKRQVNLMLFNNLK